MMFGNRRKGFRRLAAVVLCLAGIGVFRHAAAPVSLPPVPTAQAAEQPAQAPAGKQPKVAKPVDYQIIVDRNLFGMAADGNAQEASEKQQEETDPLEGLAPTTLDVRLLGTVYGDKDEKKAVIFDNKQRTQEMYVIGDSIQGAFIKDILRERVVLHFNGKDEILEMQDIKNQKAGSAVSPGSSQSQRGITGAEALRRSPQPNGNTRFAPNRPASRFQDPNKGNR